MMSVAKLEQVLGERLERLTGDDATCCVPQYRSLAEEVRRSPAFPTALARHRALADENRLLAISMLRREEKLCACEIQAATGLTHATVSHHMSILLKAGLVTERREGKWTYYRLSRDAKEGVL